MGLEKAGEMYLSKSGKGIVIKLNNSRVSVFTLYLVAPRSAVEALLKNHVGKVAVKVVTS